MNPRKTTHDLEDMSWQQLDELEQRIKRQQMATRELERQKLLQRCAQIAEDHGFDLRALFRPEKGQKRKGERLLQAAKYRNPDKPSQIWVGRGRYPLWLKEKLHAGEPESKFLIKKDGE